MRLPSPPGFTTFASVKRLLAYKQHWLWLLAAGLTLVLCVPRLLTVLGEPSRGFRRGVEGTPGEALVMCAISFLGFLTVGYLNALWPNPLRPTWLQLLVRFGLNVLAVLVLTWLSVRLQELLTEEMIPLRPRRTGYFVRYAMGALLTVAVFYARVYFLSAREMAVENARINELHARAELAALQ